MHDVKILIDHVGMGTLSIDGVDVGNYVRGFELKSHAGEITEMKIDVIPVSIDGQAAVVLGKLGVMNSDRLKWTDEKPTKPGWYWLRKAVMIDESAGSVEEFWLDEQIVKVENLDIHGVQLNGSEWDFKIGNISGEWAGPLEPPV